VLFRSIAYHYSINRIEKFQKEIIFTKNFKVNKNFIHKIEVDPNEFSPFTLTLVEEEFANGENWESKLHRILNTPGWTFQTLSDWLRVWMDCFKKQISYLGDQIPLDYMIEGKYLDAIPRNLILTENGFQFIDLEWNYKGSISFQHILFRALSSSFFTNHNLVKSGNLKINEYKSWNLIKKILIDFNYWLTNADFIHFTDQENEFGNIISDNFKLANTYIDILDTTPQFKQDFRICYENYKVIQSKDMTLEEKDRVIQSKDMVLEEKQKQIQFLSAENKNLQFTLITILGSTSWKITYPLRALKKNSTKLISIIKNK